MISNAILTKAQQVKCLICDVDGILTDGRLYIDSHGNELKAFHVQDGMGLKLLMHAGIYVAIITTSTNPLVGCRIKQLGITHYFQGQIEKTQAFNTLKNQLKLSNQDFAYMGDDLPDLAVMKQIALGVTVPNAVDLVKQHAHWQTTKKGGKGAVRELCDLLLSAQSKLEMALARYYQSHD